MLSKTERIHLRPTDIPEINNAVIHSFFLLLQCFIVPFGHISTNFFIHLHLKKYNSAVAFFVRSKLQNSKTSIFRFGMILKADADVMRILAFRTFTRDKILQPFKSNLDCRNIITKQRHTRIAGHLIHGSFPFAPDPVSFQRFQGRVKTFRQISIDSHRDAGGLITKRK